MAAAKKPAKPRKPTAPRDPITIEGISKQKKNGSRFNILQQRFIDEYVANPNPAWKAVERAGYTGTQQSMMERASRLLALADVCDEIKARMSRVSKQAEITAERVIREAWNAATVDVNELVEYRRTCCRHCYGIDFAYQRTVSEMNRARSKYEKEKRIRMAKGEDPNLLDDFDEQGGIGYDGRKPPNPDCTECWGDGVGSTLIKDTRLLSPEARSLYIGVKTTKDGEQLLTVDRHGAREQLMKHFGLYKKDNEQKNEGLAEIFKLVHGANSRLPIKDQE